MSFLRANLYKANLTGCDLKGAVFSHAILRSTCFKDAVLDDAMMVSADVGGTYVQNASVVGLNITDDRLGGLDALSADQRRQLKIWKPISTEGVAGVVVASRPQVEDE